MTLVDDFKKWLSENHEKIVKLGFKPNLPLAKIIDLEIKPRSFKSLEPDLSIDFYDKECYRVGTINIWLDGKLWLTILKSGDKKWLYSKWHEEISSLSQSLDDFIAKLLSSKLSKIYSKSSSSESSS